jgi:hypothetical protein
MSKGFLMFILLYLENQLISTKMAKNTLISRTQSAKSHDFNLLLKTLKNVS